jgi:glycosyltransferase involved in cell wall biosynthesis
VTNNPDNSNRRLPRKPAVVTVFGLVPRYIGGSENYTRELSIQLDKLGWNSVVCFLKAPPDDVRAYLDLPNLSIEVLEGSELTRPTFATLKKLAQILRKHNARILHLHLVGFVGPYPWWARLVSGAKVFFTNHTSQPEGYQGQRAPLWKRFLVRVINWPMNGVVCVSEYNRRCLTELGVLPADRFTMIFNGVDFKRVERGNSGEPFRLKHNIPDDRILIVQTSWIIPEKGIGDLLEAARLVVDVNPKLHIAFVGAGDAKETFVRQIEKLGLVDHVTWAGLVKDPFAEGVYDAADIVCQPSRWNEAFGQVIAEAMACGKPVIGTRVGGIPEVIDEGVTGLLVNRRAPEELAETILALINDPARRRRMGDDGREVARQKFELSKIVSQTISFYGISK